ncbi:MAG: helix-turn-helix domain-containing protein [Candidatus Binatia bacterium]
MARTRPPDRLDQIVESALRVFAAKGYRRTQMADVARSLGVSAGMLYNYVESKEALFHLLVERAFRDEAAPPPPALPLRTPPPGTTLARARERLLEASRFPAVGEALLHAQADDVRGELARIVGELYTLASRTRLAVTLIERSALELPELARVFRDEVRPGLVQRLTQYLERRMDGGQLRRTPHPGATARLIFESVVWFARHRHEDPDTATIDDDAARETVIDFVVGSLPTAPTP